MLSTRWPLYEVQKRTEDLSGMFHYINLGPNYILGTFWRLTMVDRSYSTPGGVYINYEDSKKDVPGMSH